MGSANINFAISKDQKRLEDFETLIYASRFFADDLLKRHKEQPDLHLKVQVVPWLNSEYNAAWSLSGKTWDVQHPRKKNARLHRIELVDHITFPELLKTLAHELVHVVQFHTGRCKIVNDEWFWKGTSYGTDPYVGASEDYLLPWEFEAATLESKLAAKFMRAYYKQV